MTKTRSHRRAALGALAVASIAGLLVGCYNAPARPTLTREEVESRYAADYPVMEPGRHIRVDGNTAEWPGSFVATADADYIYVRFQVRDARGEIEATTLQAAPYTLALYLDVDGNTLTGQKPPGIESDGGLGVDLEIQFSPATEQGESNPGVGVWALGTDGSRTPLGHADIDFVFSPTYAARGSDDPTNPHEGWYEARIARRIAALELRVPGAPTEQPVDVTEMPPLPTVVATHGGGIFLLIDDGDVKGRSDPFTFALPAPRVEAPLSNLAIPAKRGDVYRVVSWNVHKDGATSNTAPFTRILKALNPDVILVQEWDGGDPDSLNSWFSSGLGGTWNVVTRPQDGVAIITRYAVLDSYTDDVVPTGGNQPVRFVSALLQTPFRDSVIGCLHLKCCGSAGSEEDRTRVSQAVAVNRAMASMLPAWPTVRLIGGDFNLVGSRDPLDILMAGLDSDGGLLAVASPTVLGDNTVYTWWDSANSFSPGRLDFGIYSDGNADVATAFVLDTARLSDQVLAQHGLERGDSRASDHLPVVIDIRPR